MCKSFDWDLAQEFELQYIYNTQEPASQGNYKLLVMLRTAYARETLHDAILGVV